jgi:predicted glycoside hydrolase/deacetylase ChbG (UPF0249 family)
VIDDAGRPSRRLLIVTADDYGLTDGISRGIVHAHRHGIVTTASILAVGKAFELAASWAEAEPNLAVGAHLAMVGEDPPLLSAQEIPTLVDARGRFPAAWRGLMVRALAGRVNPDEVHREFSAQIQRIRGAGLQITHLDTHQHVHLWPAIAEVVVGLAGEHGIPAIRVPGSRSRLPVGIGVDMLSRRLRRRARAAGLVVTDGYAGLDDAGRMDRRTLARTITAVGAEAAPTVEINVHPGEPGDPELQRFAWGYDWAAELDALVDPAARALTARFGFDLGSYADLARREVAL